MNVFLWAQTNEAVGLTLIEHADAVGRLRNGEFQGRIRDLGTRLAQSPSPSVRSQLITAIAQNPQTFLSNETHFWRSYKCLLEDPDPNCKLALIASFAPLTGRCSSSDLRGRLFSCLLPCFAATADPELHRALLRHRLFMFVVDPAKLTQILPKFMEIFENFKSWRLICGAIEVFNELPPRVIQRYWPQMAALVYA